MITVRKLKQILSDIPDDSQIRAYEGEDVGLTVILPDGSCKWIRARDNQYEDDQPEFIS